MNSPDSSPSPPTADLTPVLAALREYDLRTIESTLNTYAVVLPPRALIMNVVLPLLRQIGDEWEAGQLRPAQEHVVSGFVRDVLGALLRVSTPHLAGRRMVFATPSGEHHELGLLSAALLAATRGAEVFYLGPDLPPTEIWQLAMQVRAEVIVISLTMMQAMSEEMLHDLAEPPRGVEIWLGGPAAESVLARAGVPGRYLDTLDTLDALVAARTKTRPTG